MAKKENTEQSIDSRRALPKNKKKRDINHNFDDPPTRGQIAAEKKRTTETNAGQKDMFEDPIPTLEDPIKYRQPLLNVFLYLVDLGKNIISTNRQQLVHGAA